MSYDKLLNWAKDNKKQGYSDGEIKKHLIQNNYDEKLIESVLKDLNRKTNKKNPWVIFIILGIVFVGFAIVLLIVNMNSDIKVIDCGFSENFNDCFIKAAKGCEKARIVLNPNPNLFKDTLGLVIDSQTYYEILGLNEKGCLYYYKILKDKITLAEEFNASMMEDGATNEEIQDILEISQQSADLIVGKESYCFYPINDLIAMLQSEQNGNYSFNYDDIEKYSCYGSMYGEMITEY